MLIIRTMEKKDEAVILEMMKDFTTVPPAFTQSRKRTSGVHWQRPWQETPASES